MASISKHNSPDNFPGNSLGNLPDKILIVCFGAIGDVTRALPILDRIKKTSPKTKIHWAIEPRSRSIIENHPDIDVIHEFYRPGGLLVFIRFLRELRRQKFELVLDLQRHFKSGVATLSTGAKRRIAFNKKNSREFNWLFSNENIAPLEHFSSKVYHYQEFGNYLKLEKRQKLNFNLESSKTSVDKVSELLKGETKQKLVALILGSTWPSRFWFVENYVELINKLDQKHGIKSVLIGGKSEQDFASKIQSQTDASINLVNKTSLEDLIPVFKSVSLALGSDSGPMHIATACEVPVISLWGATSPKRSAPYGSEDYIMQSKIGCSPCYKSKCPGLNRLCMREHTVEKVLSLYEKMLSNL